MKASQKLLESPCLKETFPLKSECLWCDHRGKVYCTLSAVKYSSANENRIDRSFLFCAENLGVFTFDGGAAIFHYIVIEIWEDDLLLWVRRVGRRIYIGAIQKANLETIWKFSFLFVNNAAQI